MIRSINYRNKKLVNQLKKDGIMNSEKVYSKKDSFKLIKVVPLTDLQSQMKK